MNPAAPTVPGHMVFGVGLSKTGTHSLNAALTQLGWPSIHYPDPQLMLAGRFAEALGAHRGATDISAACVFERLDQAYPGARFVLTVRRDLDAWLDSIASHYARRESELATADPLAARYVVRRLVYGTHGFDRATFAAAALAHERRVRAHFASRPADLLVLDVCAGEGYERLCPFLGVATVDAPFPRRNARPQAAV